MRGWEGERVREGGEGGEGERVRGSMHAWGEACMGSDLHGKIYAHLSLSFYLSLTHTHTPRSPTLSHDFLLVFFYVVVGEK